jgi:hypothetical protein
MNGVVRLVLAVPMKRNRGRRGANILAFLAVNLCRRRLTADSELVDIAGPRRHDRGSGGSARDSLQKLELERRAQDPCEL